MVEAAVTGERMWLRHAATMRRQTGNVVGACAHAR